MRYFVVPTLNNKQESKEIVNQLKTQTEKLLLDDLIVGYIGLDLNKLFNEIKTILHFYTLNIVISNKDSYKEFLQNVLSDVLGSNLDKKKQISILLTLFLKLGLTIKPLENKNEEINNIFFIYESNNYKQIDFWFDNFILLDGYYNPLTHSPFNKENILELDDFVESEKLIFNIL